MDVGTIDHGESAILPVEREKQIRAAEHDSVSSSRGAELMADGEEYASLRFGDAAGGRHLHVGVGDEVERVAFRQHNFH